jgi:hypothetical protein
VNHIAPSPPAVMPCGSAGAVGQRELHDRAVGGDPSDPAGGDLDEPDGAVVAGGDAHRREMAEGNERVPGSGNSVTAVGGDPADAVGGDLGEPQRTVRSGDDAERTAVRGPVEHHCRNVGSGSAGARRRRTLHQGGSVMAS